MKQTITTLEKFFNRYKISRWVVAFASFLLVILVITLSIYYVRFDETSNEIDRSSALAAFTSYENGQVSLEVAFYDDQGNEVPNIVSLPNENVTVRLKYANTGELQATGASITSTLPAGFTYVPGTLQNVFDNSVTVPLQDTRVVGQDLTVSPTAGLYNFSDDDATGILDIGKSDYLRVQKCSVTSSDDELFAGAVSDQSQASNNSVGNTCSTYVAGSFLSGISIPLINQRYLKSVECQPGSTINETFAQFSGNTAAASSTDATGNICATALVGSTFETVTDIDLTSGRYARVLRCDHPTNDDEFLLAPQLYDTDINTTDATGENCATAYSGSTFLNGNNIDLLDTTNSEGYIEFQMTTAGADGCYDIAATLASLDFTDITDTNTCGVRVQSGSVLTNGQIIFNKTYYNGLNNVNSATLPIGGQVRVRLNYENTSTDIGYGLGINDSFDTTYFEYVTGSAIQCYYAADCVSLDDASFSSGTISLGPSVGVFGYGNTESTTPLEPGRERYIHMVQCFNGTQYDNFVAESNSDPLTITGSCSDYGLIGYTKSGSRTIDIAGKRYLNMMTCESGGFYDTFVGEATNTPGESSSVCTDYGLTGYTNVTSFGVDLESSTELNLKRCDLTGVKDTYVSEASSTAGASATACFDSGTTGYSDDGGLGVSTSNTDNGYGYIEYSIRVQDTISLGTYGTSASMSQAGVDVSGSITDPATCPEGSTGPNASGECDIAFALPQIYWRCEDFALETGYNDVQVQTAQNTFIVSDHDVDQTTSWLCNANKEVNLAATTDLHTQIAWVCTDYALPTGYNYVYVYDGLTFTNQANSVDINDAAAGCAGSWSLAADGALAQQIAWVCSGTPTGFTTVKGITDTGAIDITVPTIDTACGDVSLAIVDSLAEVEAQTFNADCPVGYVLTNDECILNGEAISSITADSSATLTVQLFCDSIAPVGGVRNITLSDAELRTDQDFTCNYDAAICPVVFEDANLNSQKDDTENIYDVITVELRRSSDNSLVDTLITDTNAVGLQCFEDLASGVFYDVTVINPPTSFSTTGENSINVESTVLLLEQPIYFGYSDGGVLIDSSPEVFFPGTSVSSSDVLVNTVIPFVEVRDLRSADLPWTVTGVVNDFTGTVNPSNVLPISNRFTTIPQTVTVQSGDSQIITKGSQYTVTSTVDPTDIFNTGANDGNGQYSISVDIDYNVPAYTQIDSYQTVVTFTLI